MGVGAIVGGPDTGTTVLARLHDRNVTMPVV